tara:strand:- start:354 stop:1004 length:651 start_codon:yes stop_codon:yes gene_type:complete
MTLVLAGSGITPANLADGTDGEMITWNASGVPAAVAVGTATHVLTSNGAGAAPTFQAASGGFTHLSPQTASGVSQRTFDLSGGTPKMIVITLDGVSNNSTGGYTLTIGDAGGLETSGYISQSLWWKITTPTTHGDTTASFTITGATIAAHAIDAQIILTLHDPATWSWTMQGQGSNSDDLFFQCSGGKALSAALTQLSVITANEWDAGSINVMYME